MPDQPPPQVVVNQPTPEPTWSAKEVFADLKADLIHRFDKTDTTLEGIDRRLDQAATREDVTQLHRRIDGLDASVNDRLVPLEQQAADERAVEQSRGRFRTNLAWAAGIVGAIGIVAAAVIPFVLH